MTVVDSVKALLRDPNGDIRLEELLDEVVDQVLEALSDESVFPTEAAAASGTVAELTRLARRMLGDFETALEPLTQTMILAGTFGQPQHDHVWTRAMEAIAAAAPSTGNTFLLGLHEYPVVWLSHAVGIAAADRQNFSPSRAAMIDARLSRPNGEGPVLGFMTTRTVFDGLEWMASAIAIAKDDTGITDELVRALQTGQQGKRFTPVSDMIHDRMRVRFQRRIRSDLSYTKAFDRASVLMDASTLDLRRQLRQAGSYLPAWPGLSSYTWRYNHAERPLEVVMKDELNPATPFLSAGYFGGDLS